MHGIIKKNGMNFFKEKEINPPILSLIEMSLVLALTAVLMTCDPFRIYFKIMDFLRLNYAIFTKEPKLLFYLNIYIGSFVAKAVAIVLIAALLISRRASVSGGLGFTAPKSKKWLKFIMPFLVFCAVERLLYCRDPLIPNLPIRMVFPDAMIAGNTAAIFSSLFIAPIAEEVIFRGYFFDVLKRSFGAYLTILLTSVIFALVHGPQLKFELIPLGAVFTIGLVLGYFRYESRSILPPIAFHFLANLVYIAIGIINFYISGY